MTKASDNPFPSLLLVEGTEPAAPSAGEQRLYIDSTTHHLMRTDSSGTEVDVESGSGAGGGVSVNHALGKSYTLSPSPNASYPDASSNGFFNGTTYSGQKLTDGVYGGAYTSGESVGWDSGTAAVIRIDLGSAKAVGLVIARGRFGTGGIGRPNSYKVEHSDDDSSWTTDLNVTGLTDDNTGGDHQWTAVMDITDSTHRYWRVTLGRMTSNFLFVNEVELWGTA